MSAQGIAIALLLGSFLGLMVLRVPVAFALGMSSVVTAFYLGLPMLMIGQRMVNGLFSFTFLAVPFFILVGNIMTEGGISDRLVKFAEVLVGRFRGGLAQGNVVASTFFGGISGSSVADVASIGSFLIPAMKKRGYAPEYSVAVTVTSSVQGVLIPPSQNMIYYALAAGGLPISKLFLAGYVPGVLLSGALMVLCWIAAVRHNHPKGDVYGLRDSLGIVGRASIGLFEPSIVIAIGTGEGAFLVTKQLAFHQFARDGRAVDAEHRPIRPRAGAVQGAGDQFFSRATFATNQDASGRAGNSGNFGFQVQHTGAFTQQVIAGGRRLDQPGVFGGERCGAVRACQ